MSAEGGRNKGDDKDFCQPGGREDQEPEYPEGVHQHAELSVSEAEKAKAKAKATSILGLILGQ